MPPLANMLSAATPHARCQETLLGTDFLDTFDLKVNADTASRTTQPTSAFRVGCLPAHLWTSTSVARRLVLVLPTFLITTHSCYIHPVLQKLGTTLCITFVHLDCWFLPALATWAPKNLLLQKPNSSTCCSWASFAHRKAAGPHLFIWSQNPHLVTGVSMRRLTSRTRSDPTPKPRPGIWCHIPGGNERMVP